MAKPKTQINMSTRHSRVVSDNEKVEVNDTAIQNFPSADQEVLLASAKPNICIEIRGLNLA